QTPADRRRRDVARRPPGLSRRRIVRHVSERRHVLQHDPGRLGRGNAAGLVYFIFDLLHLDGENIGALPLIDRKARLARLLSGVAPPLHYSDYHRGGGPAFHAQACKLELEGIVSKRADVLYAPGNRGIWLKVKCLYREEFVVVGWTDPE